MIWLTTTAHCSDFYRQWQKIWYIKKPFLQELYISSFWGRGLQKLLTLALIRNPNRLYHINISGVPRIAPVRFVKKRNIAVLRSWCTRILPPKVQTSPELISCVTSQLYHRNLCAEGCSRSELRKRSFVRLLFSSNKLSYIYQKPHED